MKNLNVVSIFLLSQETSGALGDQWTPAEVGAFFQGMQRHGCDWGAVAGLVATRSAEQCKELFNLHKPYLSLPENLKSVEVLAGMVANHYDSLVSSAGGNDICSVSLKLGSDGRKGGKHSPTKDINDETIRQADVSRCLFYSSWYRDACPNRGGCCRTKTKYETLPVGQN